MKTESIDLKVRHITLSFSDEQTDLEDQFLQNYFTSNLKYLRLIHFIAIFFYGLTGILDYALFPDAKTAFWIIRYGFIIPVFALGVLFTFSAYYQKCWQLIHAIYIFLTGGGFIVIIAIGPKPEIYSYYVGIIICLFFGYTFCRERFIYASVSGCLLLAFYLPVSIYANTPPKVLLHNSLYLCIANFLGMMICYFLEFSARRDFLLVNLYQKEREKVTAANFELEKRVKDRTSKILEANKRLKEEMEATIKAEKEKRKLEVQLQRSKKMESLGTLAGGVAHDLNNILSGVVSYPDLLLSDLSDESPLRSALLTIKKSGEKAAAIVQDLLTLARRGVSISKVVNINSVIEDYLKSAEFQKLKDFHPKVVFEIDLKDDLLNIMGSSIHISKTIMNLVSNAAEAMPEGGKIGVYTKISEVRKLKNGFMDIDPGRYATVEVSDEGIGIAPDDLERIFEPFYTKKVMGRSGTGLGMAVVWGTIHDHNGYIDVKSTLGSGTTFILYFPLTDQPIRNEEKETSISMYKGNGESILVVDDVKEQRDIASKILTKLGYAVKTLPSGEEAVKYMRDNSADILVLDMIMNPGMDGLETYRQILELHPNQKAIIASGFSETSRVTELQRLGGGKYLRKPYRLDTIGIAIKKTLEC
jgi:signal transduction histidine kinase